MTMAGVKLLAEKCNLGKKRQGWLVQRSPLT